MTMSPLDEFEFENVQQMYDHDVRVDKVWHADEIKHAPCPVCGADVTFRVPYLGCPEPNDDLLVGVCDCTGDAMHLDGDRVFGCGEPCDPPEEAAGLEDEGNWTLDAIFSPTPMLEAAPPE